jgi:predicted Rossmann fold flavoprotein
MRGLDHIVHCVQDFGGMRLRMAQAGFTLTPPAEHPFGTGNSLVQLDGFFIEFLHVPNPALVPPAQEGHFSFPRFNQAYMEGAREGVSMLVFESFDAASDLAEFKDKGLVTYEPFGFSRQAKLPGGDEVTVGFSLAFVTHDDMPRAAFFTCQQHAPEHFWKPEYQRHANTAKSIGEVALVCEQPLHYVGFLENLTGLKALQEDAHAVRFGAGAAGLMCAAEAAAQGGRVLVIDHARNPGEKIRISGGGRCNFTNLHAAPENFLSANPHFAKSALARYTQWDFIELVDRHRIPWHEKTLGQLFCDRSAKDIIAMLLDEMRPAELRLATRVSGIDHGPGGFALTLEPAASITARHLVVACGGKSIPKMGATGFGYEIADRFGHSGDRDAPRAGAADVLRRGSGWAQAARRGLGAGAGARGRRRAFEEALLFTHRGLSGPAILQVSSYWREGEDIVVDLGRDGQIQTAVRAARQEAGRKRIETLLAGHLPRRLAEAFCADEGLSGPAGSLSDRQLSGLFDRLTGWRLRPSGTEGYRTAEVTLGGVATDGLDARTMESKAVPGLFFIGEVVDVTGWLGGYNFQWAWSSGWAGNIGFLGLPLLLEAFGPAAAAPLAAALVVDLILIIPLSILILEAHSGGAGARAHRRPLRPSRAR